MGLKVGLGMGAVVGVAEGFTVLGGAVGWIVGVNVGCIVGGPCLYIQEHFKFVAVLVTQLLTPLIAM